MCDIKKDSLYVVLSNCIAALNSVPTEKWQELYRKALGIVEEELLPSGSGFDASMEIAPCSTKELIVINTEYHFMDDVGQYRTWWEVRFEVEPLFDGFKLNMEVIDPDIFWEQSKEFIKDELCIRMSDSLKQAVPFYAEEFVDTYTNPDGSTQTMAEACGFPQPTIMNDKILDKLSEDLEDLILCTFRYYLGRQTIHACMFAESLSTVFPMLSISTQKIIIKDLDRAFEGGRVGHKCDEKAWAKVRDRYQHVYKCPECGYEEEVSHHVMQEGVCLPLTCENKCGDESGDFWMEHVDGYRKSSYKCENWR